MNTENEKQLMTTNCVIYLVTNLINGKKYVGQTQNTFYKRYNSRGKGVERIKYCYETDGKGNSHLYNSICKYGTENFKVEIIHIAKNKEELNYFESFYERYYQVRNPMKGYNAKPCGDSHGGYHRVDEYWLERIRFEFGKKIEEQVRKFLIKRQKDGTYNGNECYILAKQRVEYLGVKYNGLLNIPKKITKTSSIKKLYDFNYSIITKEDRSKDEKVVKRKIINQQKKQAMEALENLYEPYYDDNDEIPNEIWEQCVKLEALQLIENSFPELYGYLIEKYSDVNWMLRVIFMLKTFY